MSATRILATLTGTAAFAAAVFAGYWWYANHYAVNAVPAADAALEAAPKQSAEAKGEGEILYWHDPMHPQHKFDKPGKSPFMDMDLVPVYGGEAQGASININPAVIQSLGVRSVEARIGTFERRVDSVGTVQADERRISVLQSRAAGWLEKLHLRAVNDPVKRGAPVAEVYAPELLAAQEEYLLLTRGTADGELAAAARERLSLLGLTESQIRTLEKLREPARRVVLYAPSSGIVTELGAREGAAVSPGMPVANIVDLSRVWVVAQVPEMQLAWISTGQPAEATLAAMPGQRYGGNVEYVYPDVDPTTRTVKVRFSVDNPAQKLRPGMVANVTVHGGPKRQALLVPVEAVIRTGTRSVVIVEEGAGRFRAQEVATGLDSGDQTEITAGLSPGERVVISGQFLIDSEASFKGAIARLEPGDTQQQASAAAQADSEHVAQGTVESVDPAAGKVVIAHGPVASLDWPAMTMGFAVKEKTLLGRLKLGQEIEFRFVETDGDYVIGDIRPVAGK